MSVQQKQTKLPVLTLKPFFIWMIFNNFKNVENRNYALPPKFTNTPIILHASKTRCKNVKVLEEINNNFDIPAQTLASYTGKCIGFVVFTGHCKDDDEKFNTELAYINWPEETKFHWKIGTRKLFTNFAKYNYNGNVGFTYLKTNIKYQLQHDGELNTEWFKVNSNTTNNEDETKQNVN